MAPLQANLDSSNSDDTLQESNHRKRRKIGDHHDSLTTTIPWRSDTEQRTYSSKLVEALRHVLRRSSPPERRTKPSSSREVRDTAYRVLAATAKGRTRWSRAILASRLSRRRIQLKMRHKKAKKASNAMVKRLPEIPRRLPVVQRKARVLSRLVPGCRKVPFPNLLEEATDYIAALQMQVKAMTALTELLDGVATPENRLVLNRP